MDFILNKRTLKSVEEYCNINNIDVNEYLNDLFEKAHFSNVYSEQPGFIKPKPILEIEKKDIFLEKQPEMLSEPVTNPTINTGEIQVVEIDRKPKVRILK
jgi:hypothetical protein